MTQADPQQPSGSDGGARVVLLSREQSSMVPTWNEYLCLLDLGDGNFELSTSGYEILGSIYDVIPDPYDENGELIVPETWNGRKVTGLSDNEYLETDEMVDSTSS